tara:strand:+ start:560 stop:2437 length:1878 start_codon:yes stop_codon:yes gene_type:complete
MSRTRDIADIMGKSEAVNPANVKFLKLGDAGGDASNIVNITVNGSGTADKIASNRIELGDAVVVVSDGTVQSAGQPYSPHRFLNDSASTGDLGQRPGNATDGNPYPYSLLQSSYAAGNQNYGAMPDVGKYLGGQKILFCWLYGYYALAQIARLNSAGTTIEAWGPTLTIQGQGSNSSLTTGARNFVGYDVEKDTRGNPTGYAYIAYNYLSRTGGSYSYNYYEGHGAVLYNDITDINDLTVTKGAQHIWGSSKSQSSQRQHDMPRVVYDPHKRAWAVFYHDRTGSYDIECRYVKRSGTTGYQSNQVKVAQDGDAGRAFDAVYNVKDSCFHIAYREDPNASGSQHYDQLATWRVASYDSSTDTLSGYMSQVRGNPMGGNNEYFGYDLDYDSGAGCGICAAVQQTTDVGTLFTMKADPNWDSAGEDLQYPTVTSSVEFAVDVNEIPLVAHIKGLNKNIVVYNQSTGTGRQYAKFFTCDSNGGITLEDSDHSFPELPAMNYSSLEYIEDYDILIRNQYYGTGDRATYRPNQQSNGAVLILYDPERREVTNVTPNNFLGIAQDSADSGDAIEVKVNGSIDTNQTGLSPGFTYYINEINGDLEPNTNNGSVRAGIATAVGNIKILSTYDSA